MPNLIEWSNKLDSIISSHSAPIQKGIGERILGGGYYGTFGFGASGGWADNRNEMVLHLRQWVYVAIQAIMKHVAGLSPNIAFVRPGDPRQIQHASMDGFKRKRWEATNKAIKPHEEIEPVGYDHPLAWLLKHPNALDTPYDLWAETFLFLKLTGNAYWWIVPNSLGTPVELWVIPSQWVRPHYGKDRLIDYYSIMPWAGVPLKFPAEEMLHFKYKSPLTKIDGYSPQTAGAEWIDAAESVNKARYYSFKNGVFPTCNLKVGPTWGQNWGDEQVDRIQSKFLARLQGESNYGLPAITPPDTELVPLAVAPVEMAYVESADQLRDWILALFSVPKGIVGIEPGGNNISRYAEFVQFYDNCLKPDLQYLSQALTCKLAVRWDPNPQDDAELRVWWDDPTPADPAQVNADLTLDLANGVRSINEARATRGLPPFPLGGDNPMLPMALSEVPWVKQDTLTLEDMGPGANQPEEEAVPGEGAPKEAEKRISLPSRPTPAGFQAWIHPRMRVKKIAIPDIRQTADFSCGSAAFRAICLSFGVGPQDEYEYSTLLGTTDQDGTTAYAMLDVAKELGLAATEIHGLEELKAAIQRNEPVLCAIQRGTSEGDSNGHWVVAFDIKENSVYVQDPVDGPKRIGLDLFIRRWHDQEADNRELIEYGIAFAKAGMSVSRNGHVEHAH